MDEAFTAQGAPNIAFVKYWGKRDERLILPCNSSLSMTLSAKVLNTTTSVVLSRKLKEDEFYLDGQKQDLKDKDIAERFDIVNRLRDLAGMEEKALVVSRNNFPASSGMASSASGIATLACALNHALGLKLPPKELSIIARRGSGSACRSIFGGIVVWQKGTKADGSDSYAEQAFDEHYWPEVIDIIAVVSQAKKKVSSRAGMRQTVQTNPLYASRPGAADRRVAEFVYAYMRKDFASAADIIMTESNEMHALMMSTKPPIRYLNRTSYSIMDAVEELNSREGRNVAAYTFDAGANAHIITLAKNMGKVMEAIKTMQDSGEILYTNESGAGSAPSLLNGGSHSLIDVGSMSPKQQVPRYDAT